MTSAQMFCTALVLQTSLCYPFPRKSAPRTNARTWSTRHSPPDVTNNRLLHESKDTVVASRSYYNWQGQHAGSSTVRKESILLLEYCLYYVHLGMSCINFGIRSPCSSASPRFDVLTKTHISGALPVLFTLAPSPPISYEHQHDLANINESTTGPLSTLHPPS